MSKMFRLVKGELGKLLLRPIVYGVIALLVVALLITFISFSASDRISTTDHYTSSDINTTQDVVQEFSTNDTYGKSGTDKLITKSIEKLNFYKIIANEESSTILTKSDLMNMVTHIQDTYVKSYKDYLKVGKDSFTTERATACANAVNSLIEQINDFRTSYNTVISNESPIALISQANNKSILENTTSALNYLKPNEPYSSSSSYESFVNLESQLDNKGIFEHLTELVRSMEDIQGKITVKDIEEAEEIINDVKAYLDTLAAQIATYPSKEDVTIEVAKADANRYNIIGIQTQNYVDNLILSMSFKGLSDAKINTLNNYENVYQYKINESLSMNKYLLTHSPILAYSDYSSAFSTEISSADKISAFDFTYFGLGICSIVVIIFCVIIGAGMVAGEQTNGTLRMLMLRPFSRNKIISSKILSTVIFGTIFMLFASLILFISGAIIYGIDLTPILFTLNSSVIVELSPIVYMLIYILLIIFKIYIYSLVAIGISVLFRSNVGAVLTSVLLFVISIIFGIAFSSSMWLGYLPAGNFDLFKYFGGSLVGTDMTISLSTPILHGISLIGSVIYTLVIVIILEIVTHQVFKSREIK